MQAKVMKHHGSPQISIDLFFQDKFRYYLENTNTTFQTFFPLGIPKHIIPNKNTTPFFTGHGPFFSFINRLHAQTTPKHCSCGSEETPLHLLLECIHTKDIISNFFHTRNTNTYTKNKTNYIKFSSLCKSILLHIQITHSLIS